MDYKNVYLRTVFPADETNGGHEPLVKVVAFFITFSGIFGHITVTSWLYVFLCTFKKH